MTIHCYSIVPSNDDYRITEIENRCLMQDIDKIYDFRGYYRTGIVDIGAFEFGASKYLLSYR